MNDVPEFPCATSGCVGERLTYRGLPKANNPPKPYDDNPLCPYCRKHGALFGPDVAAEAHRLAERLVQGKGVYP